MVAQLFKPSVYLNETYIQNTRYVSQVFLNPEFPEVIAFRESLLAKGDAATQGIAHVESQMQYLVEDELEGGARIITSIEEVMNLTDPTSCWILAKILSVEGGPTSWCYLSCHNCYKKVIELKNGYECTKCKTIILDPTLPTLRYRLHLIVADATGITERETSRGISAAIEELFQKKFLFKLEVSRQNVNSIDFLYSVTKISDDERLIGICSAENSSQVADSNSESQNEAADGTPVKPTDENSIPNAGLSGL
ncbi:hypothetical protein PIB30_066211 [Stylosanthes scabra]|uniref:Replication factor A C-terminal domain-containing protein n=1 Tax=Stylosanthes scabra TaxID=79078 RepID=A0ABU6YLM6_9FABA|nr:hypothetical protein [Stylosanthes scabra]